MNTLASDNNVPETSGQPEAVAALYDIYPHLREIKRTSQKEEVDSEFGDLIWRAADAIAAIIDETLAPLT